MGLLGLLCWRSHGVVRGASSVHVIRVPSWLEVCGTESEGTGYTHRRK